MSIRYFTSFTANNSSQTHKLGMSNRSENLDGYWLAIESGDYLQIDFVRRALIMEIWSQGAVQTSYWTRNFTVAISNDGVNFVDYEESGVQKV